MSTTSVMPFLIGFVLVVTAVASAVCAPTMPVMIRITAATIFLMLALFCVYGFIAAMEPSESAMYSRVAYPLLFFSCLAALGRLAFSRDASQQEKV